MHRWYLKVMGRIRLSTLFVTHDIDEALLLSDRVLVLKDGAIAHSEAVNRGGDPKSADFALTESVLAHKRRILDALGS